LAPEEDVAYEFIVWSNWNFANAFGVWMCFLRCKLEMLILLLNPVPDIEFSAIMPYTHINNKRSVCVLTDEGTELGTQMGVKTNQRTVSLDAVSEFRGRFKTIEVLQLF
jgi:hypothetical protein